MKNSKKIYGFAQDGTPLRSQKEVVRNYFIHNTGKYNAISHTGCEQKFGFKRLSALVFDIEKEDNIIISREEREVPTRYEGITSRPTFYWVERDEAEAYINGRREKTRQQSSC